MCYRVQANEIAPNVTIISIEGRFTSKGFNVFAHSPNEKISLASKSGTDMISVKSKQSKNIKVQYEIFNMLSYQGKR